MPMRKGLIHLIAAAALTAAAAPAAIVVTWTGTVLDGTDHTNYFGLGLGSNLAGQNFTAVYQIDPANGTSVTSAPNFAQLRGGTGFGPGTFPSPFVLSTLTINGTPFTFQSGTFGGYERDGTPGRTNIYTEVNQLQGPATDILFLQLFRPDNSIPFSSLNETLAVSTSPEGRGFFQAFSAGGSQLLFSSNLTANFVTIGPSAPASAVPEPGTALLVCGALAFAVSWRRLHRPV